jgi:hypothetical protein
VPPGPEARYGVHFLSSGPGVPPPLSPLAPTLGGKSHFHPKVGATISVGLVGDYKNTLEETLEHGAWALANLGFPYLVPIVVVKTIRALLSEANHSVLRKKLRLTYLFREGQYALTSLAVSTAAFYELMELGEWSSRTKLWLAAIAVLSAFAVILVVIGLVADTEDPETAIPPGSGVFRWSTITKWMHTYRVGTASILIILPVSLLSYQVHEAAAARQKPPQASSPSVDKKSTPKPGE